MSKHVFVEEEKATGDDANRLWIGRVHKALQWRQEHWNGDKTWKRSMRLIKGKHWSWVSDTHEPWSDSPRDRVTVNVTASTVQDFVPFLLRKQPEFLIKPRKSTDAASAVYQQRLLNYMWRQRKMNSQVKLAVFDAVAIGHGILKTGWTMELTDAAKPGVNIRVDDAIKSESPWLKRVSPFKFLIDPDAQDHDLATARWVAEVFFRPLQDVILDKRYNSTVRGEIRRGEVSPTTYEDFLSEHTDEPRTKTWATRHADERANTLVAVFEIWDKRFRRRKVFIDGIERPVIDDDWPWQYMDSFPYVMVPFMRVPDEHYPMGLVQFMVDQQLELNRIRTKEFQNHRRTGSIVSVARDFVKGPEIDKITSGQPLAVIEHTGSPSDEVVRTINLNAPSFESHQLQGVIYEDLRRMSGSDALLQGGSLKSRTSATEVNQRANFIGLKMEDRVENVDEAVTEAGSQILAHIKANAKLPQMVPLLGAEQGRDAAITFENISPSDIQGEFDITMHTVSAERVDKATERQQRMQILQFVLANAQFIGNTVNIPALITWVMESFDVKDSGRFLTPVNSPFPPPDQGNQSGNTGIAQGVADPLSSSIRSRAQPATSGLNGAALGQLSLGNNAPQG